MPSDNQGKDFSDLRQSDLPVGSTRWIGQRFINGRFRTARVLIRLGFTPNHVTILGFVFSALAGLFFFFGAGQNAFYEPVIEGVAKGYWPLWAALMLFLAGACDMLDGAVARLGGGGSQFGALLDSTLDRMSDIVIYMGMCGYFAWKGNLTYCLLAVISMCNGYLISYVKARSEDFIDDCTVGYWLRGERCAGLLIATVFSHIPAWLWLQAISPMFSIYARLRHAYQEIRRIEQGEPQTGKTRPAGLFSAIRAGVYPRGSIPYDIVTFSFIGSYIVAPWIFPFFYGASDPLRTLFDRVFG